MVIHIGFGIEEEGKEIPLIRQPQKNERAVSLSLLFDE